MADRGTDLAYSTLDSPYVFTEKDLIDRIINVKITTKPFSTSKIVAHKVEEEEKILKEMEDAQKILLDNAATTEEKNAAYETLQQLNYKKGKI